MKENNSRRKFLSKAGGALLVSTMFPHIWVKKSFARETGIILGYNAHRDRVVEVWGLLDSGKNPVNDCYEMVEDAKGRLMMHTNETRNNILVYDKSGKLLESWWTSYPGRHGLTLTNEGRDNPSLLQTPNGTS